MRILSKSALFWSVVVLAMVNVAMTAIFSTNLYPSSMNIDRITIAFRGWPEYLSIDSELDSQKKIVFVGNSNATGRELPGSEIYTSILNSNLSDTEHKAHIVNWGMDGLIPPQIPILVQEARKNSVSTIYIVASVTNFIVDHDARFRSHPADLDMSFPVSWIVPTLTNSPGFSEYTMDDILWGAIQRNSELARSRNKSRDYLARRISFTYDTFIFGSRYPRKGTQVTPEKLSTLSEAIILDPKNSIIRQGLESQYERLFSNTQSIFLQEINSLIETLEQTTSDNSPKIIWIWEPLPTYFGKVREQLHTSAKIGCQSLLRVSSTCYNFVKELPESSFFNPFVSNHLNHQGHEDMAALLLPLVLYELR